MTLVEETIVAGFPSLRARGQDDAPRPPVVFIHGMFGDQEQFRGWLELFAEAGYDGVAPSRRGRRGLPPAGARGLRVRDYLDDTLAVMDTLPQPPILAGHSMGGTLGLLAAERRPVAAVVMLSTYPGLDLGARPTLTAVRVFAGLAPAIARGRPVLPPYSGSVRLWLEGLPEDERRRVHGSFVPESARVMVEEVLLVRADPRRVRCPVLIQTGLDDHAVPPPAMRRGARRYHAGLIEYPGRGHWLFQEPGWQGVARDTLGWLETVTARGAAAIA